LCGSLRIDLQALVACSKGFVQGKPDKHPQLIGCREPIDWTASCQVDFGAALRVLELPRVWRADTADADRIQRALGGSTPESQVANSGWGIDANPLDVN
jgi:hypothetical protein